MASLPVTALMVAVVAMMAGAAPIFFTTVPRAAPILFPMSLRAAPILFLIKLTAAPILFIEGSFRADVSKVQGKCWECSMRGKEGAEKT